MGFVLFPAYLEKTWFEATKKYPRAMENLSLEMEALIDYVAEVAYNLGRESKEKDDV